MMLLHAAEAESLGCVSYKPYEWTRSESKEGIFTAMTQKWHLPVSLFFHWLEPHHVDIAFFQEMLGNVVYSWETNLLF